MNKLKKFLSVFLTLVMLFTTFCFFPLDLGVIEADAAITGIKIVVPETIYLTPSTTSTSSGQLYVNNNANGSANSATATSANVHIAYPGATLKSVTLNGATATWSTAIAGKTMSSSATTGVCTVNLTNALSAGGTALVEWVFKFDVNGAEKTHYAYTVAYAPWYLPVGAAARAVGAHHNVFSSSILWVSGVHGYSVGDSVSDYLKNVQTANFLPMFGTIKAPENNDPTTNWILDNSSATDATISYYSISQSGTDYHARANSIAPTANLTVDTSRYNNFSQIPNFRVGFMVTDHENAGGGSWYVSDYGNTNNGSYYNGVDRGSSQYDGDYNDKGTVISGWSSDDDAGCGIKVNQQTWNKAISGTANFRLKSGVRGEKGGGEGSGLITSTSWNNNFVNINVTGANKGTLRTKVIDGASYAKENYTTATWNNYYAQLKAAATNLGNPTSATTDASALTNAEAALFTTAFFDANGGTLGFEPASVDFQIGGNDTASFAQSALLPSYSATRTGYTLNGWSLDKSAATAADPLVIGHMKNVYAIWIANKYTIAFNANGGAGTTASVGATYDQNAALTANAFTRDNYVFTGWNTAADGSGTGYSDKATVKNLTATNGATVTLYAQWTPAYYISFNANGGSGSMDSMSAVLNKDVALNANKFTRTGYAFNGWNTAANGSGTAYADKATVRNLATQAGQTVVLYAQWTANSYTVNYDSKGGSAVEAQTVKYDAPFTLRSAPVKTGYTFKGWEFNGVTYTEGQSVSNLAASGSVTLTAIWEANTYTIKFNANTGSGEMTAIAATYDNEYTFAKNAFTKTGYVFSGWNTSADGNGEAFSDGATVKNLASSGEVTLYAQWEASTYTINYDTKGGSAVEAQTATYDKEIALQAAPSKTGYIFKGWEFGGTTYEANEAVTNLAASGSITLTAKWEAISYTVTFNKNADGINGTMASMSFKYDEEKALTANGFSKDGWTFLGWSTTADGGVEYTDGAEVINLTATDGAEVILYAVWDVDVFTVTFNYKTASGEDKTVSKDVTYGTEFNTIIPDDYADIYYLEGSTKDDPHYVFASWANAVDVITADGEFTAVYNEVDHQFVEDTANTKPATCTGDGIDAYYCKTCGFKYQETVGATGHAWTVTSNTATCTDAGIKYEFCPLCQGTKETEIDALGHTDGEWKVLASATCTSVGREAHYCGRCNKAYETKELPMVAHSYSELNEGYDATCEDTGIIDYYTCATCYNYFDAEKNIADTIVIPAKGHSYGELQTGTEATCEEEGEIDHYICSACDKKFDAEKNEVATIVIPKKGHSYGELQTGTEATCEDEGEIDHYICSACTKKFDAEKNEVETLVIPAKGHTYGELQTGTEATCEDEGEIDHYICSVCTKKFDAEKNEVETLVIPAKGHSYGELQTGTEATCEEEGEIDHYICSVCTKKFDAEKNEVATIVIPKKGHTYGELQTGTEATCEDEGEIDHYICSACDKKFDAEKNEVATIVIPAKGHTYGELQTGTEATCEDEGEIDHYICSACDKKFDAEKNEVATIVIPKKGHSYGELQTGTEATCEETGVIDHYLCSACDKKFDAEKNEVATIVIPAKGHVYGNLITGTEATCEGTGIIDHYTCSVCTKNFDAEKNEVETLVIPAKGHDYGTLIPEVPATCEGTGVIAHYDCSACDKMFDENKNEVTDLVIPAKGHSYKPVVTLPTCLDKGYTTHTCSVCGDSYKDTYVDALGHSAAEAVVENDIPASCLVNGSYDEVVYCSVCKTELSRTEKVHAAPGHTEAVKQDNVIGATCTTPGSYDNVTYCTVCNTELDRDTVTGVTLPHTPDEAVKTNIKDSTCYQEGSYVEVIDCAVCGSNISTTDKVIEKKEHTPAEAVTEKFNDSTCYAEGTYDSVVYCAVSECKHEISRTPKTIEKKEHTPATAVKENINDSTCYQEGTYESVVYCAVSECKHEISRTTETIEKKAHTPAEAVVENEVDSTCYEEGSYDLVVYCSVCAAADKTEELSRETKTIEKKAHTPAEAVVENEIDSTCYAEGSYDLVVYCSVCAAADKTEELSRETKTIEKKAHTPAEAVVENEVDSTCYAEGSYDEVVYCSVCKAAGKTEELSRTEKTIEKKAHTAATAVVENEVDSTCYAEGTYDEVVYCSVCAAAGKTEELSRTEKTIEKKAHTAATAVVENEVDSTCYAEGSYDEVVYCSVCAAAGKREELSRTEKTIEKKAHTAGETVIENTVAPKCEENGSHDEVVYCSVCEAAGKKTQLSRETVVDAMTGHTSAEAVTENNVAPKCEEDGSYDTVVYCSVCGEELSRVNTVVPATGHTPAEAVTENNVAPKCEEDGSYDTVVYCSVCGEELSRVNTVVPATGHTAAASVIENENAPTCDEDGSYDTVVYCSVCGEELSRVTTTVPATGHTEAKAVVENKVDPDCENDGSYDSVVYCSVCGEELSRVNTVVPATGHTAAASVIENENAPTCEDKGSYDVVVYCSVCDKEISRNTVTVNALGHTEAEAVIENQVAVTCTADGGHDEVIYCTVCKKELERVSVVVKATGHKPAEAVKENIKEATETENGSYDSVVYCSVCGEELSREVVVTKMERTISFVLYDRTVIVKAYTDDTVKAPAVPSYTDANGFVHAFKGWDKPITVVKGDATYTAVYTESCDYTGFDVLKKTLNEILDGNLAEDDVLNANKTELEQILAQIEVIEKGRSTRDKSEQSSVDFVANRISNIIDIIYPDLGSTLEVRGSAIQYVGTTLDLQAVKMPYGVEVTDATWTSSDEDVVFFSNGKLFAVATGTVTITATKGLLTASKTITVIEGGNIRGITFTSIDKAHFIIEDYKTVYNSAIVYWSDDYEIRFRVRVYQNFIFEDYIVYINGKAVEPDANGYYTVPAGSGDVIVTIAGAVIDTGDGGETVTKWSFWEWLMNLFRKIVDFFKNIGK